jgi:hypothetical protein
MQEVKCYTSNCDTFDVYVFEVLHLVAVRSIPSVDRNCIVANLSLEKGRFISGVVVNSNFLKLEGCVDKYVPIVTAGDIVVLRWVPMERGICSYRVVCQKPMSLRYFPDYLDNCRIDERNVCVEDDFFMSNYCVASNSIISGFGRVRGQFGDIFVRIQVEGSGRFGWVFCSKEGVQLLEPVDLSTHHRLSSAATTLNTGAPAMVGQEGVLGDSVDEESEMIRQLERMDSEITSLYAQRTAILNSLHAIKVEKEEARRLMELQRAEQEDKERPPRADKGTKSAWSFKSFLPSSVSTGAAPVDRPPENNPLLFQSSQDQGHDQGQEQGRQGQGEKVSTGFSSL